MKKNSNKTESNITNTSVCTTTATTLAALLAAIAATAIATAAAVSLIGESVGGSSLATAIFIAAVLAAAASALLAACIAGLPSSSTPTISSNTGRRGTNIIIPLKSVQDGFRTLIHITKSCTNNHHRTSRRLHRTPTRQRHLPGEPPSKPSPQRTPENLPISPSTLFHERCRRILETCDLLVRHFPKTRTICILRTAEEIISRRPQRLPEPDLSCESDIDVDLDPVLADPDLDEALRRLDQSIKTAKKYKEGGQRLRSIPLVIEAEKQRYFRSSEEHQDTADKLLPVRKIRQEGTSLDNFDQDFQKSFESIPKPKARPSLLHANRTAETEETLSLLKNQFNQVKQEDDDVSKKYFSKSETTEKLQSSLNLTSQNDLKPSSFVENESEEVSSDLNSENVAILLDVEKDRVSTENSTISKAYLENTTCSLAVSSTFVNSSTKNIPVLTGVIQENVAVSSDVDEDAAFLSASSTKYLGISSKSVSENVTAVSSDTAATDVAVSSDILPENVIVSCGIIARNTVAPSVVITKNAVFPSDTLDKRANISSDISNENLAVLSDTIIDDVAVFSDTTVENVAIPFDSAAETTADWSDVLDEGIAVLPESPTKNVAVSLNFLTADIAVSSSSLKADIAVPSASLISDISIGLDMLTGIKAISESPLEVKLKNLAIPSTETVLTSILEEHTPDLSHSLLKNADAADTCSLLETRSENLAISHRLINKKFGIISHSSETDLLKSEPISHQSQESKPFRSTCSETDHHFRDITETSLTSADLLKSEPAPQQSQESTSLRSMCSETDHQFRDITETTMTSADQLKSEPVSQQSQKSTPFRSMCSETGHQFRDITETSMTSADLLKSDATSQQSQESTPFRSTCSEIDHQFRDITESSMTTADLLKSEPISQQSQESAPSCSTCSETDLQFHGITEASLTSSEESFSIVSPEIVDLSENLGMSVLADEASQPSGLTRVRTDIYNSELEKVTTIEDEVKKILSGVHTEGSRPKQTFSKSDHKVQKFHEDDTKPCKLAEIDVTFHETRTYFSETASLLSGDICSIQSKEEETNKGDTSLNKAITLQTAMPPAATSIDVQNDDENELTSRNVSNEAFSKKFKKETDTYTELKDNAYPLILPEEEETNKGDTALNETMSLQTEIPPAPTCIGVQNDDENELTSGTASDEIISKKFKKETDSYTELKDNTYPLTSPEEEQINKGDTALNETITLHNEIPPAPTCINVQNDDENESTCRTVSGKIISKKFKEETDSYTELKDNAYAVISPEEEESNKGDTALNETMTIQTEIPPAPTCIDVQNDDENELTSRIASDEIISEKFKNESDSYTELKDNTYPLIYPEEEQTNKGDTALNETITLHNEISPAPTRIDLQDDDENESTCRTVSGRITSKKFKEETDSYTEVEDNVYPLISPKETDSYTELKGHAYSLTSPKETDSYTEIKDDASRFESPKETESYKELKENAYPFKSPKETDSYTELKDNVYPFSRRKLTLYEPINDDDKRKNEVTEKESINCKTNEALLLDGTELEDETTDRKIGKEQHHSIGNENDILDRSNSSGKNMSSIHGTKPNISIIHEETANETLLINTTGFAGLQIDGFSKSWISPDNEKRPLARGNFYSEIISDGASDSSVSESPNPDISCLKIDSQPISRSFFQDIIKDIGRIETSEGHETPTEKRAGKARNSKAFGLCSYLDDTTLVAARKVATCKEEPNTPRDNNSGNTDEDQYISKSSVPIRRKLNLETKLDDCEGVSKDINLTDSSTVTASSAIDTPSIMSLAARRYFHTSSIIPEQAKHLEREELGRHRCRRSSQDFVKSRISHFSRTSSENTFLHDFSNVESSSDCQNNIRSSSSQASRIDPSSSYLTITDSSTHQSSVDSSTGYQRNIVSSDYRRNKTSSPNYRNDILSSTRYQSNIISHNSYSSPKHRNSNYYPSCYRSVIRIYKSGKDSHLDLSIGCQSNIDSSSRYQANPGTSCPSNTESSTVYPNTTVSSIGYQNNNSNSPSGDLSNIDSLYGYQPSRDTSISCPSNTKSSTFYPNITVPSNVYQKNSTDSSSGDLTNIDSSTDHQQNIHTSTKTAINDHDIPESSSDYKSSVSPCSNALPSHFYGSLERTEEPKLSIYNEEDSFPPNMRVPHRRAFWDSKLRENTESKNEPLRRKPSINVPGIVQKQKELFQIVSSSGISTPIHVVDDDDEQKDHRQRFQEAKHFFQNLQRQEKPSQHMSPMPLPEKNETKERERNKEGEDNKGVDENKISEENKRIFGKESKLVRPRKRHHPATVVERFNVAGVYEDVLGNGAAKTASGTPLRGVPRRKAVVATLDSFNV